MARTPWKVEWDLAGDAVHVRPRNDRRWHLAAAACWCRPDVELIPDAAPWLIHNAADGRARPERIEGIDGGPTDWWRANHGGYGTARPD